MAKDIVISCCLLHHKIQSKKYWNLWNYCIFPFQIITFKKKVKIWILKLFLNTIVSLWLLPESQGWSAVVYQANFPQKHLSFRFYNSWNLSFINEGWEEPPAFTSFYSFFCFCLLARWKRFIQISPWLYLSLSV